MKIPSILCFLLLAHVAMGQKKITATATIDKAGILIGEQAQLDIKVTFPPKNKLSFFSIDSIPHFEIIKQGGVDTVARNDTIILSQRLTITSWDSGTWQIPAFRLVGSKTVQTKPLPVTISFSQFDPGQEYHGIKDILDVTKEGRSTWWWYVVTGLLLIGLFLLLFPRRKKQDQPVAIPKINAYQQAMIDLEQLSAAPPADDKVYFTRLIDIFRNYLQQRKGIHSFQKTTDDLSRQLHQLDMDPALYSKMVDTLQLSDFVKFARYVPASAERIASLGTIQNSIHQIEQVQA